tara:strand:- start:1736 stop:2239 length:504 start_codon:yes stop_codon:yes gene_type:complete
MELENYIVPYAIYHLSEMEYVYPTWCVFVSWMLYDIRRHTDVMMISHHICAIFIAYWLMLFERNAVGLQWVRVAGLMELSGCSTTIYTNLSARGYWDKVVMLSVYCTIRFWKVPLLLMELDSLGACQVPLMANWFIVAMSAWWVRKMFVSALLGTFVRLHNFNLTQY